MAEDIHEVLGIPANPSAPPEGRGGEPTLEFIRRVRLQTCYSTLRGFITFFAVVGGMASLGIAGFFLLSGLGTRNPLLILASIGGGVLGVLVFIAWHQASSLLIDIADTLIEQNRRKSPDHDALA